MFAFEVWAICDGLAQLINGPNRAGADPGVDGFFSLILSLYIISSSLQYSSSFPLISSPLLPSPLLPLCLPPVPPLLPPPALASSPFLPPLNSSQSFISFQPPFPQLLFG